VAKRAGKCDIAGRGSADVADCSGDSFELHFRDRAARGDGKGGDDEQRRGRREPHEDIKCSHHAGLLSIARTAPNILSDLRESDGKTGKFCSSINNTGKDFPPALFPGDAVVKTTRSGVLTTEKGKFCCCTLQN